LVTRGTTTIWGQYPDAPAGLNHRPGGAASVSSEPLVLSFQVISRIGSVNELALFFAMEESFHMSGGETVIEFVSKLRLAGYPQPDLL